MDNFYISIRITRVSIEENVENAWERVSGVFPSLPSYKNWEF